MTPRELLAMVRTRRDRHRIYSQPGYWDGKAERLAGHSVSMWPNNVLNAYYHEEQMALIDACLPDLHGQRVLDVGCGYGRLARFLAERAADVVGIDFSPRSIELARSLTAGANPTYRVQSVFEVADQQAYDVVVSWGCLAIACRDDAQLRDALSRLVRALEPGGRMLLLEPLHRGFLHRVLDLDVRAFTAVLEEAGTEVQAIHQLHCWPARLLLAYVPWPRVVTAPVYRGGQALMRRLGSRSLGDYKAILARRAPA